MLKFTKCCPIIGSRSTMVVGFVGVEVVIVHVVVSDGVLMKSVYSLKTGSLQLRLF